MSVILTGTSTFSLWPAFDDATTVKTMRSVDEKVNRSWPLEAERGFPASRKWVEGRVAIVAFLDLPGQDLLSLKSICIPSSIETISKNCFRNCKTLSILTFEAGCKVSNLGESAFENCSSLQSICIPSSIETISNLCFYNCTNLSILTFDTGCKVSNLGGYAFQDCSSLQSICIPSSIATISSRCFCNCTNLSIVTFEAGARVSTLDNSVFAGCSSLGTISLPSSLRLIE
jgi:hypothetical protein